MKLSDKLRGHAGLADMIFPVESGSMQPVVRLADSIRLRRSSAPPQLAQIWVVDRGDIHFVHRVLWVRDGRYLLKGDWNLRPDGWFPRSALFGPVLEIQHNGKWRPANRLRDRVLGLALSGVGTTYQASRLVARRLAITVLGEPRARRLKTALLGR